jgi:hypothetical protein
MGPYGNARLGAKLAIDRRCLAGGGHSAWSAPLRAVDEDPDEAGALFDFHFRRVREVFKKLYVMELARLLALLSRSRPRWGGRENTLIHAKRQ